MAKLYVGNLPYKYNDADLKALFDQYGEVTSAVVIMDKMSGRSKGFGFVELGDDVAETAMSDLNGKDVDGLTLKVSVARPMEERPRNGGFNNRSGGGGFNNRGGSRNGGGYNNRY
jgi:RNA recognition motif-containing protein